MTHTSVSFSHAFVGCGMLRNMALAAATCLLVTATSSAGLFQFSGNSVDGHPVKGSADFTFNPGADTVTVKLTNSTTLTNDAGELFTGLDFSLGGLVPSMTSDTGVQREVFGNGTYADSAPGQDLSWSLVSLGGGNYQLNFNPNAKDSIIGPPTGGVYVGNGSINGNNGHNPFAAEMATFVLSVPNLEANTPYDAKVFRYGTGLDPATGTIIPPPSGGIPEPATALLAMGALACLAGSRRGR